MTIENIRPRLKQTFVFGEYHDEDGKRLKMFCGDIDHVISHENLAMVIDFKMVGAPIIWGDRRAYKDIVQGLRAIGRDAYYIVAEHATTYSETVDAQTQCIVKECVPYEDIIGMNLHDAFWYLKNKYVKEK